MTRYIISLSGCDDETHGTEELTDEQYAFLKGIAKRISQRSRYGCMPTMTVQPFDEADDYDKEYATKPIEVVSS